MTNEPPRIEQKVLRFFGREQSYWTANGALISFNSALALFGFAPNFVPPSNIALRNVEYFIGAVALIAILGIALHMFNRRSWLARWSYLWSCFATALTTMVFVFAQELDFNILGRIVVFGFLATGGLVALSMHVEYGNRRKIYRTKADR